jgi:hypothetical protein
MDHLETPKEPTLIVRPEVRNGTHAALDDSGISVICSIKSANPNRHRSDDYRLTKVQMAQWIFYGMCKKTM